MSITIDSTTALGEGRYRVAVTSSLGAGTTIYWRIDGDRVHAGLETTLDIFIEPGSAPLIDIRDDGWGTDEDYFPGHVKIQFFIDESGGDYSTIEIRDGSANVLAILESDGRGWYEWTSDWLSDETTYTFVIVPIGVNGNDGTSTTHTVFVVRNPDAPDVAWSYDTGTDKVTITAN